MKIYYLLLILFLITLLHCGELSDFNNAEEAYFMPDVDLYVARGTSSTSRFNVNTGEDVHEFILRSFQGNERDRLNHFLSTLGVSFQHSRIRLFYIRLSSDLDRDTCLTDMMSRTWFELTDEGGSTSKGTVYVDDTVTIQIFFVGDTVPAANFSGLGTVGFGGTLIISKTPGPSTNNYFSELIAHELGHNFGLPHPFTTGGLPNPNSCEPAAQGTTNRVMDYVSNVDYFSPCERFAAAYRAEQEFIRKKGLNTSEPPRIERYIGDWAGTLTVGQPGMSIDDDPLLKIEVD